MCEANEITIKDPDTGSVQCQECIKCPAGEGLSVNCGDFVSPQTPLVCKPCVPGETYSSAYEAGACKDCKNCGEYRETKKPCTLTSKAVCGKCKHGAYYESMLTMCKPCSSCCNDGKDILVPECQVPGVPANMQCSFLKSEKCSKVNAKSSTTTAAPTLPTTDPITIPPELGTTPPTVATIPVPLEPAAKQVVSPTDGSSPNRLVIAFTVGGPIVAVLIVVLLILLVVRYKRKKVRKGDNNTTNGDIEMQPTHGRNEGDGDEADEPNPDDALLENNEVPLGVEESTKSPLPVGTQETKPPGPHSSTVYTPVQDLRQPSCDSHSHTKIEKTTVKQTTVCIKGCKCQLTV